VKHITVVAMLALVLGAGASAQDNKPAAPAKPAVIVGQREVDKAVQRGADYLKKAPSPGSFLKGDCDELILLTLVSAEVPESNADFQRILKNVITKPLEHTYKVALMAMALQELDASAYQMRIAQCAQYLVDNICTNGQWNYGKPTDAAKLIPFEEPAKKVASGPAKGGVREFGAKAENKKPSKRFEVKPTRTGGESGDNSNTQYGALGLRACAEANIKVPEEVLYLARKWWIESQWPDESDAKAGANAVASGGPTSKIQGWSYKAPGNDDHHKNPYGAMTVGGVGALCILDHLVGKDFKKDPVVQAGVNWIAKHFAVNTNYYYLYGLERAGMLYGVDTFGGRLWYTEGARLLLDNQNADGSWGKRENAEENTWDTCFAILFLKKATRAIASGPGR
jgi:hypothetical protein